MDKDSINLLAGFLRKNKQNKHKINLVDYMQERICKYSVEEKTPAEQIKGMNRLLRDVYRLDVEVFGEN